jgi:hypothetical protein
MGFERTPQVKIGNDLEAHNMTRQVKCAGGLCSACGSSHHFPNLAAFRRRCAERLCACLLTTVSLIVLSAALYVILSGKYPAKVEHWAYATIGTVLGFWLRQA